MKILIVSQSFYPDNFKINELIKDFADKGHDVTVLSGLGDYTTGKIHPNYRFFKGRNEIYNGCKVKRVRTISRRKGPIFRSLNYLSFVFFGSIWAFFHARQFDAVYVYQPSPATMIYPGIVAAKKSHAPLLIYCLDIWPEAVKAMNITEKSPAYKWIHKLSRYAYQKADYILVSSRSFIDYLHEENQIDYAKMSYLPQHADITEPEPQSMMPPVELAKYNFVFTGNIGYVQDVETIIRASALVPANYDFKIHLVGDGSNYQSCRQVADEVDRLDRVVFYGRQPADLMPNFYQVADACLLTLKYENKIGLTIPAKLQGYLAAEKPVIAAIEGDARTIIEESDCGLCVPASDTAALAQAFITFIELPQKNKEEMAKNALNYFKNHFSKADFVEQTLTTLIELVAKKKES